MGRIIRPGKRKEVNDGKFIEPYFCSGSNCVIESLTHFAYTGKQWKLMILSVI